MSDYSQGKISKVVNTINDKIYIGSTTRPLAQRMGEHRKRAKSNRSRFYKAMRWHVISNFSIQLIQSFPCSNVIQLEKKEYTIINKMLGRGIKLYNSMIDGKHAASTKKRMGDWQRGAANHNYGKVGSLSAAFKRGNLYHKIGKWPNWVFSWRENGKHCSKSFSVNKYGHDEAKRLAEKYRNKIYPIE